MMRVARAEVAADCGGGVATEKEGGGVQQPHHQLKTPSSFRPPTDGRVAAAIIDEAGITMGKRRGGGAKQPSNEPQDVLADPRIQSGEMSFWKKRVTCWSRKSRCFTGRCSDIEAWITPPLSALR